MLPIANLLNLLNDLQASSQQVLDDAVVERGAGWIRQLEFEFPLAHQVLMSALYKEPGDVLNALAAMNPDLHSLKGNELVLNYVGRLQLVLRGDRP
jgi:hypothetical protein